MAALINGPYGKHVLPDGYSTLGRSAECDISLDDPRLSRKHARFFWHDGVLVVEDLSSHNGILVNGELVVGNSNLFNGNMIAIGPAVYDIIIDDSIEPEERDILTDFEKNPDTTKSYRESKDTEGMQSDENLPLPLTSEHERDINHVTSTKHALTERKLSDHGNDPRMDATIADELFSSNKERTSERFRPSSQDSQEATNAVAALQPNETEKNENLGNEPATDDYQAIQAAEAEEEKAIDELLPKDSTVKHFRYTSQSRSFGLIRILAACLDGLQNLVVTLCICFPIIAAGYTIALLESRVSIHNGLPSLDFQHEDGNWIAIIESLFTSAGWERAYRLSHEVYEIFPDSFIWIFSALTLSILAAVLYLLMSLVAATTIKGAPFWHRRLGLVILERQNGFYPTPLRCSIRWLCAVLLAPISLLFACCNARGPHDLIAGCEVKTLNDHH